MTQWRRTKASLDRRPDPTGKARKGFGLNMQGAIQRGAVFEPSPGRRETALPDVAERSPPSD
jgi:hypothetical protein